MEITLTLSVTEIAWLLARLLSPNDSATASAQPMSQDIINALTARLAAVKSAEKIQVTAKIANLQALIDGLRSQIAAGISPGQLDFTVLENEINGVSGIFEEEATAPTGDLTNVSFGFVSKGREHFAVPAINERVTVQRADFLQNVFNQAVSAAKAANYGNEPLETTVYFERTGQPMEAVSLTTMGQKNAFDLVFAEMQLDVTKRQEQELKAASIPPQ